MIPCSPATDDRLAQDAEITGARHESKYLIASAHLGWLARELSRRICPHRFTGENANRLPAAQHYVTTVYFDTPSRTFFRRALRDPEHHEKLRAKEYYDIHPALAELATDPAQILRHQPWLWLELKRRDGTATTKQRFRLRKQEVSSFLARERSCEGELESLADYFRELQEPLLPSCLVNYRRLSWQDPGATVRVTLDSEIAFYAPPADLWSRSFPLLRGTLGTPRGVERELVLEVKRRHSLPSWLDQMLCSGGARPVSFSKFMHAARAVHGD